MYFLRKSSKGVVPTKNVIILVVTVTVRGPHPNYISIVCLAILCGLFGMVKRPFHGLK